MDLFGFNGDFGFNFGGAEEQKENTPTPTEKETVNVLEETKTEGTIADVATPADSGMEDIFGGFGFATETFFEAPKKETKKKEEKAAKPAKKEEKAKKESKSDKDVKLPVVVKARNFSEEITGDGTKKLSEIWKILLEKGYDQFKSDRFSLTSI